MAKPSKEEAPRTLSAELRVLREAAYSFVKAVNSVSWNGLEHTKHKLLDEMAELTSRMQSFTQVLEDPELEIHPAPRLWVGLDMRVPTWQLSSSRREWSRQCMLYTGTVFIGGDVPCPTVNLRYSKPAMDECSTVDWMPEGWVEEDELEEEDEYELDTHY